MAIEPAAALAANHPLQRTYVYGIATLSLMAGLMVGYLVQGLQPSNQSSPSESMTAHPSAGADSPAAMPAIASSPRLQAEQPNGASPPQATVRASPPTMAAGNPHAGHMPTLVEMKQLADKQAAPLLEKLKSDPDAAPLLLQIGAIYHGAHQFPEAATYYAKAVKLDPGNVAVRVKLASSLYRSGDVDAAITQLNRALHDEPTDANALFDLGMIRLQGKQDSKGALDAWRRLLKTNPQLSSERRASVEKLMANVMTTINDQEPMKRAKQ
jgi:predicted Zn-dependent protease